MMKKNVCFILFLIIFASPIYSQTIAEKKAGLGHVSSDLTPEMQRVLTQLNSEYEELQKQLRLYYFQAQDLYARNAPECDFSILLEQINTVKQRMIDLQVQWRTTVSQSQKEEYALWHQPNTTLDQLIFDYGAQDYIYLVPEDIGAIQVSVNSGLPIPRSSWGEILELVLSQNGVGIRQLNPFLRELYFIQEDNSGLEIITNDRDDIVAIPSNERVAFLLSPEPSDVRRTWFFLEKFTNSNTTVLQMVGRDILIIATAGEVLELLKLYDFITANRGDKEYKVVPLLRVDVEEMAQILGTIFGVLNDEAIPQVPERPSGTKGNKNSVQPPAPRRNSSPSNGHDDNGLKIIPLAQVAQAIFLVGTKEEIRKAEGIIREVEEQVGESHGRVIFWYNVKHSDPEELAEVLSRIYNLMIFQGGGGFSDEDGPDSGPSETININDAPPPPPLPPPPLRRPYEQGFFLDDSYVVNNDPPLLPPPVNQNRDNFIVDPKSGSIVMVVEADILPRLRELIKRLDMPKKMVQIEVLLFEKRLSREDDFGLNLLKIGAAATNNNATSATFNARPHPTHPMGIFDFFISRAKNSAFPAFDLLYRFLLTQDDIHINASPSVLAVNQTPAVIEITDEISVNTGIYAVDTVGGVTLQNAFARARYGIKIEVLPTIHLVDEDGQFSEGCNYVTLDTDISFQTINNGDNPQQPDVTTRHVVNEVRIPDGQTVILGGLRRRDSQDSVQKVPFLGDIPGVGKLFSQTQLLDETTEMFIFLTPKIIFDPCEDLERLRREEMCRRPGDIPSFLCRLVAAEEWEKNRLFSSTMTMLFGRRPDRCVCPTGEYDGR